MHLLQRARFQIELAFTGKGTPEEQ
jgi:hypothetical protein